MNNIEELSGRTEITYCDGCGNKKVCHELGIISPISRTILLEKMLCTKCLDKYIR